MPLMDIPATGATLAVDKAADPFISAVESGTFAPIGTPERIVPGVLSVVFVKGDRAIKVYRHAHTYYGDLIGLEPRRTFYEQDFEWNRTICPHIYLRVVGVRNTGRGFMECAPADADDFYIDMCRYDDTHLLTNMLLRGTATPADFERAVDVCMQAHEKLSRQLRSEYADLFERGWHDLLTEGIEDLCTLMRRAQPHISPDDIEAIGRVMHRAVDTSAYFREFPRYSLVPGIDSHTDNLLINDGRMELVDSMMPKTNWRVVDPLNDIAKTVACAAIVDSRTHAQYAAAAYGRFGNARVETLPRLLYECRNATIQWARRHLRGEHELALRYKEYALRTLHELEREIPKHA